MKNDIEQRRSEIESLVNGFQKLIIEQDHKIEELEDAKEKELDAIFKDLINVIDSFDKADSRLAEQFDNNEDVEKARKRFATSKKKLLEILNKNGVTEIQFLMGWQLLLIVKFKRQNQMHLSLMTRLFP